MYGGNSAPASLAQLLEQPVRRLWGLASWFVQYGVLPALYLSDAETEGYLENI